MDQAGAGVQSLLDTTYGQKEVLDQQLTTAQRELERMKEVERLIEERKQRARTLRATQEESRRREQEGGDSLVGIGGAICHQGVTEVPGREDDGRPVTPWQPMAYSTPYPLLLSEGGEMTRPLDPDQRLLEVQPRGCLHSKCPQSPCPNIRRATIGTTF